MAQTANFQLSKPIRGASDWDIDLNENFDVIDSQIKVAQTLTSSKINSGLGFTPLNPAGKGVADGYASLNAAGKIPLTQLAINSSLLTTALGFTPESTDNKGVANGYASLDSNGKVPLTQINLTSGIVTTSLGYTPENVANKGQANGYAGLDSNAKIPAAQLNITSTQINSAIGFTPQNSASKGVADGYASLDENGFVPNAQLSITSSHVTDALGFTPENSANKDIANGYASLDSNGLIPSAQIPTIAFSSLTNLQLSSPAANQVLQYDGTNWVNANVSGGATLLSGMSDVQISSPSSGQILQYNGTKWINAAAPSSAVPVPVRQTVLTGAVTASSGVANFLSAGSGLAVNLAATAVPVNVAFANGFGSGGAVDYVGTVSSDVTSAFSGLPANSTSYLYVDRNSSTGALTYGSTKTPPVYSTVEPLIDVTTGYIETTMTNAGSSYTIDKLIDKNPGTYFQSGSGVTSGTIVFTPASEFCLTRYAITAPDSTATLKMPRSWILEACSDPTLRFGVSAIPVMTSNTSNGITITGSGWAGNGASQYGSGTATGYYAFFNPNVGNPYASSGSVGLSAYITIDFGLGNSERITAWKVEFASYFNGATISASNDGTNFNSLASASGSSMSPIIDIHNTTSYRYYRITMSNSNWSVLIPGDITLYKPTGWTTLDTKTSETAWNPGQTRNYTVSNSNNYKFYKLSILTNNTDGVAANNIINLQQLKFFSNPTQTYNLVSPIMTSNSTPSPYAVSASSESSASYAAWKAFDGSLDYYSPWATPPNTTTGWLKVDMGSTYTKIVSMYKVINDYPTTAPKNWTFEGSNDNTNWVILDTRTNETNWNYREPRTYALNNQAVPYRYYRINMTANNGYNWLELVEFQLFERVDNSQHWFDLNAMQMKLWNGSSWDIKQRVFLGEAVTGASSVSSVTTYALQGRYESEVFAIAKNTSYTKSHNIGTDQLICKGHYRYDQNYVWSDIGTIRGTGFVGARLFPDRNTVKVGVSADNVGYGESSSTAAIFGLDSFPAGNSSSGEAKLVIRRSW